MWSNEKSMVTFPKSPIAARQVFISTGIYKEEKKFMNEIIKKNVILEKLLAFSNLIKRK